MSIRSALGGLPSWPALVIAPLVILGVGALHYGPAYRQCTRLANARDALSAAVARAAGDGTALRLDAAVAVEDWEHVRIVRDLKAQARVLDCPFGWDLNRGERRAMIADGRLGILAFAKGDEIVDYIEYRSDRIGFAGVADLIERGEAVFTVAAPRGPDTAFVLRPAGPAR